MRILFITDNDILGHGGGCLGSRKYYDAIRAYAVNHHDIFKVISLGQNVPEAFPIPVKKNRSLDRGARMHGHSTYMYNLWKNYGGQIKKFCPDLVFLGRSRLGFIAKDFKETSPKAIVVTFIDNVEYDYVDSYFVLQNGWKGWLFRKIEKRVVYRDEKEAVQYSDKLVYLTNRDAERIRFLYRHKENKPTILPVCLEESVELSLHSPKKTIAFIGSLNYGANIKAVEELIRNIWGPNFSTREDMQLIVAGSHPDKSVLELISLYPNILLMADFSDIKDFIPQETLMVAPIPKGAGMKVKVAETLSLGLMIAASDEALVGYEAAIREDKLHGILRCNNAEEYVAAIRRFDELSGQELKQIAEQNQQIFERYYTFSAARNAVRNIIQKLLRR
jgi:hypothetical protein